MDAFMIVGLSWLMVLLGVLLNIPGVIKGNKFNIIELIFCLIIFVAVTIMNINTITNLIQS